MRDLGALTCALVAADDPRAALPDPLPAPPLELQVALHGEVTAAMRADIPRARRAAAAAMAIAEREPGDPLLRAQAHWSLGSAVLFVPLYAESLGHYDAALAAYEQARAAWAPEPPPRDVRLVHAVRIFCLNELGRYAEALEAAALAEAWLVEHPVDAVRLTYLINRSLLAGNMGDYQQMLALADQTIALAAAQGSAGRAAMGLVNRAYACLYLGRFDEAEAALAAGQAQAEAAGEPLTVARAQLNLAVLRRCQGRLAEALAITQVAAAGMAQADGEAATVALELALIYEQLRQLEAAGRCAGDAAARFAQQQMPLYSAQAYLQAARVAIQQGRGSRARGLLAHAHEQARGLGLATLAAEAAVVRAQAAALPPAPGARPPARKAARAALDGALATLTAAGLVREATEGALAAAALDAVAGRRGRARAAYRALLDHPSLEVRLAAAAGVGALLPPGRALPHLRAAADLALTRRRTLPAEELQARYSSETAAHHMRLARSLLDLGEVTAALECVWEAKAGPLLDLRAEAAAIDPGAQARLDAAKADLARHRAAVHDHLGKAADAESRGQDERAAYHRARAEELASAAAASEQQLTEAARLLGGRLGRAGAPGLAAVCDALAPGQALVEYARLDDGLVAFVVRRGRPPAVADLGGFAEAAQLVRRWKLVHHSARAGRPRGERPAGLDRIVAALRDRLVAPLGAALGDAGELIVAPADLLHHLPWAALCAGEPLGEGWPAPLLTPSGALCAAEPPAAGLAGPPRVLGYAGEGPRHLPGVGQEVAAVAAALPGAVARLDATTGDVGAGPPPRILHIAAHGVTRPEAPACSSIELRDGPLLLLEAHRLNLRGTDLVTLSACETGERPDYGEMTLALAGAFLSAGAATVLASLWAVDDRATAAFMGALYGRLAAGAPLLEAAREAQRALVPGFPLDWAAFQLWSSSARPVVRLA